MGLNNLQQRGDRDEGRNARRIRDAVSRAPLKATMTPSPAIASTIRRLRQSTYGPQLAYSSGIRDRAVAAPLKHG